MKAADRKPLVSRDDEVREITGADMGQAARDDDARPRHHRASEGRRPWLADTGERAAARGAGTVGPIGRFVSRVYPDKDT